MKKKILPGLIITGATACISFYLSSMISYLDSVTISLILGAVIGNFFKKESYTQGVKFTEKKILSYAIIFMGFKLPFQYITGINHNFIYIIISIMSITIFSSLILGRFFGLNKKFSLLIGSGTAVCGSSAIASVSQVIKPSENEIGTSIGIITLLGTIEMFLLPIFAGKTGMGIEESSLFIGGSLQAVGHVAASGFSLSEEIGNMAVTIKMLRVFMIIPIVLILQFFFKGEKRVNKNSIPVYLKGFIITSITATLLYEYKEILSMLGSCSKILLTWAMAGIGAGINFKKLIKQAGSSLLFGVVIVLIQLLSLIFMIYAFI